MEERLDTTWMEINSKYIADCVELAKTRLGTIPAPFIVHVKQVDECNVTILLSTLGEHKYANLLDINNWDMSEVVYDSKKGYDVWSQIEVNRALIPIIQKLNESGYYARLDEDLSRLSEMKSDKSIKGFSLTPRLVIDVKRTHTNHNTKKSNQNIIICH